ncbi:MAG: FGGY-family carbohydrate kinase [Actinomycetota bacterium]|nr:FGGY-family carbohydrate kinase [Actinomycetota bacterium]
MGHNFLDLVKAIMEGVGFQVKKILNVLKERGIKVKNIKMVGGGSKSKIWPNIIADITGLDVLIPENHKEDFATKGAAIIAGYGSGIFPSLHEGYNKFKSNFKEIKPDQDNIKFYEEKFRLFEK